MEKNKEVVEGNFGNFSRKFPFIPCYTFFLKEKMPKRSVGTHKAGALLLFNFH